MTALPEQRRSESELNELRMRNAFAVRPPIAHIKNQALPGWLLIPAYLVCLAGAGLVIAKIYVHGLAITVAAILAALVIFWKKPRSRHHAAIMLIISLLVLVFGTVYYLNQFEQTANDAQGPIRH